MNDGPFAALERNHFFHGKLMAVPQWEKDARFHDLVRRHVNRFVLGAGVVRGLGVAEDPAAPGRGLVRPGFALDELGRELVVAEPIAFDPHQLTDGDGEPSGDPVDSGEVVVGLLYSESKADPAPALAPGCGPGACEHDTLRLRPRLLVRRPAGPPAAPPGPFPGPPPADAAGLHQFLAGLADAEAAEVTDPSVPLARIGLTGGLAIDAVAGRPLVYGNPQLYRLLLTLGGLLRTPVLRYAGGDNQTAPSGATLPAPLVVEVTDAQGNPQPGVSVTFETASGGKFNPKTPATNAQGLAQTAWALGPAKGVQKATAKALATALAVTFQATAK